MTTWPGPTTRSIAARGASIITVSRRVGKWGVAPVVGLIGTLQALQAVRILTGHAEDLRGVMMLFDAVAMAWQRIRITARPECPVCGPHEIGHVPTQGFNPHPR